MGNPTGFINIERKNHENENPVVRINHWEEFHKKMPVIEIREQASRCMDCGVPFCHNSSVFKGSASGCPINNLIPDWNDMLYHGHWREAYKLLDSTNNFPEFTGRVCPAPCEGSCVLGIHEPPVTIKNHEYSIIENAFDQGWIKPNPPRQRTGKTIGIIGSGPAGLAAADQLNKRGHLVTVYERADRVGGLLMYGIPNMKLDKEKIVNRRIRILEKEGIEFKTSVEVGKDILFEDLKNNHDSIIICTGATVPRDLKVDGREHAGIHFAMEFLHRNTKSYLDSNFTDGAFINAEGKDVIVIGGGDTGTDCVATATRHGCKSLRQLEIMPQPPAERSDNNPWPEFPYIKNEDYGQEEARIKFGKDPREYAVMTKSFMADGNGQVKGIRLVDVEWQVTENGNKIPVEIEGTEREYKADLVLLAMGFLGPEASFVENAGLEKTDRGNIKVELTEGRSYETATRGVFAAGDCRRGQSLVVWAIKEGREAAEECHRYLKD